MTIETSGCMSAPAGEGTPHTGHLAPGLLLQPVQPRVAILPQRAAQGPLELRVVDPLLRQVRLEPGEIPLERGVQLAGPGHGMACGSVVLAVAIPTAVGDVDRVVER